VGVLALMFLFRGQTLPGLTGLLLLAIGVGCMVLLAPWRNPQTAYWKLMLPLYVTLLVSVFWSLWVFDGTEQGGFSWWDPFWLLPLLMPLGTLARRRWQDGDDKPDR
jgi:hypothetical protein